MSTSPNLPAGQFITTLNGKRCTAIPKAGAASSAAANGGGNAVTTSTTAPAKQTTTQAPPVETTTSPAPVVVSTRPPPEAPATTAPPTVQVTTAAPPSSPAAVSSVNVAPPPFVAADPQPSSSTSEVIVATPPASTSTLAAEITPSTSTTAVAITSEAQPLLPPTTSSTSSPLPTSSVEVPTSSTESAPSSTSRGIALSDTQPSATPSIETQQTGSAIAVQTFATSTSSRPASVSVTSTDAASAHQESDAGGGIASTHVTHLAPVIGGVIAGIAVVGIVALILFLLGRRRKRRERESLLTPLGPPPGEKTYYEIDNESLASSTRTGDRLGYQTERGANAWNVFKGGLAGLKSKIVHERNDSPGVNLNRGNSQFLDGPIPQHSRNNSVLSNQHKLTMKDRIEGMWESLSGTMAFGWRRRTQKEPVDPFAAARSISEKQAANNVTPDFSKLLGTDELALAKQAELRRASLANSPSNLGSLGLNFEAARDPFSDPPSNPKNDLWLPPTQGVKTDPFSDPPTVPEPTIAKASTYVADVRRSRGQSIDVKSNTSSAYVLNNSAYRPPSLLPNSAYQPPSRYPSTIAPSRDSYRDTVFSSFTTNTRKGKGRSDPFDLERSFEAEPPMPRDSSTMYPNPLQPKRLSTIQGSPVSVPKPRVVSNTSSQLSQATKYSSGVSSLGDWGDPGPDLGPSGASSLTGNAGDRSFLRDANSGNSSPVSLATTGKSVGKAM